MKGITVPCPECKNILIRYANFKGGGKFETLCPHCKIFVPVTIEKKVVITAITVAVIVLGIVISGFIFCNKGQDSTIQVAGVEY